MSVTATRPPTPSPSSSGRSVVWRWVRRALAFTVVALTLTLAGALAAAWRDFGAAATGERRERMERSPEYRDGKFVNALPLGNDMMEALSASLDASPFYVPNAPVPTAAVDLASLGTIPASGLRVTWFGHSSALLEIDGVRLLTDPFWGERASPLGWIGPRRWFPPLADLRALPRIDAVVVSHDHYDHLDLATVTRLDSMGVTFIVPLGVGAHLAYWGVPPRRIVELDWWERHRVGSVDVVSTPARHASGRQLLDRDRTLWTGFAFVGPRHRAWYSGDTGLFPELTEIGERLGPFDLTLIESGQYHRAWPDWHLGPEQAVRAHQMVRGEVMLPVHWALLALAPHTWTEPIERVVAEAERAGVQLVTPPPGMSIEPERERVTRHWWPDLSWETAVQHPVRASWVR